MEAPDREASSSADDVEAPTARKGAEEEEEESLARECMKLVILAGVIVAVVLAGEEIGKALLTTRGFLRRHVPLHFFAPALVAIQGARRLCPPVYYCMPVSSLAMLYLVSVLGWLRGGLLSFPSQKGHSQPAYSLHGHRQSSSCADYGSTRPGSPP